MCLYVIKRDGIRQQFDSTKIKNAVLKAFVAVDKEVTPYAEEKANNIAEYIENHIKDSKEELTIDEIQKLVEHGLMSSKRKDVATAYIEYRHDRDKVRKWNNSMMDAITEKLKASNVQNQNANVDEYSFGGRKGEADSVLMKQYALDNCMSKKSRDRHLNNEIYIHDLDSYALGSHNCFDSATKFITSNGVKRFGECTEGQVVEIPDMHGCWRLATVHKYGKQKMYNLTFTSGLTTKTVTCTRNHRWVLENGTITDNIQIGDSLALAPDIYCNYEVNPYLWCFGFVIGDGFDRNMYSKDKTRVTNHTMQVRLCGKKVNYLSTFLYCGWSICQTHLNGDISVHYRGGNGAFKQAFLDSKFWKLLPYNDLCNIFNGYIAADGHLRENGSIMVSTSDERVKEMIEDISSVCGYYVWSTHTKHNSTNFKKNRIIHDFYLSRQQHTKWTLTNITVDQVKNAWCLEEPITHTFMLDGGMVTGNCLSIPFDDLLAKGFNTRQVDIRPANSVNTAFQLVAVIFQLQSLQQFGGVSATHLDWTMVPYVRKSFYKHFCDGLKYIEGIENQIETPAGCSSIKDISIEDVWYTNYPKAYNYAMDLTIKETNQAVEAMYHNLNSLQSRSGK